LSRVAPPCAPATRGGAQTETATRCLLAAAGAPTSRRNAELEDSGNRLSLRRIPAHAVTHAHSRPGVSTSRRPRRSAISGNSATPREVSYLAVLGVLVCDDHAHWHSGRLHGLPFDHARTVLQLVHRAPAECSTQVDALSVLDLGDYAFARPSRIAARVGPGEEGVAPR
jgi:hypothetical protein